MRNVPDKICRENKNTIFMFSNSFPENRAVYEILWNNTVEPDRPQMTIWRLGIECRIHKATDKLRISNIFSSPLQQWLQKRASRSGYTYVACLALT